MSKGLSACTIKYIAVLAMIIDHIAWCFIDTYSLIGEVMHAIGRMTAPIMTYFIVEGFHNTRNSNKYLLRLGIFAAISYFPYTFMTHGAFFPENTIPYQSVIYTFFLTALSLKIIHSDKMRGISKLLLCLIIIIFSIIGDWCFFPIVWALLFDRYRGNFKMQAAAFIFSSVLMITAIGTVHQSIYRYGVLLALIPLYFYNGKRGKLFGEKADKWFFYIFYPLHMLILGLIKNTLI